MKNFDFITNDDENVLAEEYAKRIEFIMSLEPSELVERLEQIYDATDVILEVKYSRILDNVGRFL